MVHKQSIYTQNNRNSRSKASMQPALGDGELTQRAPVDFFHQVAGNQALNRLGQQPSRDPSLAHTTLQRLVQAQSSSPFQPQRPLEMVGDTYEQEAAPVAAQVIDVPIPIAPKAQQGSTRAVPSRSRVVAQGRRLDGVFGGAVQRHSNPANVSYRLENQRDVIQAKKVGAYDVTFTRGYATWDQDGVRWHINWSLGDKEYHVTNESTNPKKHYYFTLDAGVIDDASAPKGMKGRKGTSLKFSALPASVQKYIRKNINDLESK